MAVALVCDDSLNGLGLIRSLGVRRDISVIAFAREGSVAAASSFPARIVRRGSDGTESLALDSLLSELAPAQVIPFPGSDRMLLVLAELSRRHTNLSFPDDPDNVASFFSKVRQYEIADQVGVTTPTWYHCRVGEMPRPLNGPVAVRPANRLESSARPAIKMRRCSTSEELRVAVGNLADDGFSSIVSDFVDGPEANLATFGGYAYRGRVIQSFVGRKLWHTYPTRVVAIAEVRPDPAVSSIGAAFVEAVGLSGIFQVELKRSESSGAWNLIEMNQRNWLWGQLATAVGSNLAVTKFEVESAGHPEWYESDTQASSDAIFVNEYGVLSNIWGYRSFKPAVFVARSLLARRHTTFALCSREDRRPVLAAVRSAIR